MVTQEEMNILIPQKLRELEETHHVEILLAVESGSRAWGFASPDSDFDVRIIYKRPQAEYLRLDEVRDVIELPIDDVWDVSGWDLDKMLRLLNKSNPTLYEWFGSPICYCSTAFTERIQPLLTTCFSERNMLYHYLNTARNKVRINLSGESVSPKKYFYALRPILACYWLMERHCPPPVLFEGLAKAMLPEELCPSVQKLVDLKKNRPEKMIIPHVHELDDYIHAGIEETSAYLNGLHEEKENHWNMLNRFFLEETGGTEKQ